MKPYPIQLEISGPTAMWTRPDTGSSPVSYVAPTLQYPLRLDRGEGRVRCRIMLCAPVQFHRYTTNYGGPLRASDAMNKGASYSLARRTGEGGRRPGEGRGFTVVLANVRYRLYAQAEFAGHHDVFNRALERGQYCSSRRESALTSVRIQMERTHLRCYQVHGEGGRRPGEGRRSHKCTTNPTSAVPDYVGPFRPETRVCETENHELPTRLRMVFDQMPGGMSWN